METKGFINLIRLILTLGTISILVSVVPNISAIPNFHLYSDIILIFTIFLLIYWIYKNISQKRILLKSKFYSSLYKWGTGLFLISLFLVPVLGLMGIAFIIGVFIADIISMIIISIAYEILNYFINKKLINNLRT